MILTMSLCAVLCAVTLAYILAPAMRDKRAARFALTGAFVIATLSLGLYLWSGSPDSPSPVHAAQDQLAQEETQIRASYAKDPNDPVIMIRLAALQVYKNETNAETLALLDRAEKKLPGDRRIKFIRSMIEARTETGIKTPD